MRCSILIKCLPPYIMKRIGLLTSEYYNRHNRLSSTCPLSNLSPVFVPSIKSKIGAITSQRDKRLLISYLALKLGYIYKTHAHIHNVEPKTLYSILCDYCRTVFSVLSRGNEKLLKSQEGGGNNRNEEEEEERK